MTNILLHEPELNLSLMHALQHTACSFPSCRCLLLFTLWASGSAVTYSRLTPWAYTSLFTRLQLPACSAVIYLREPHLHTRRVGTGGQHAKDKLRHVPSSGLSLSRWCRQGARASHWSKGLCWEFGESVLCSTSRSPICYFPSFLTSRWKYCQTHGNFPRTDLKQMFVQARMQSLSLPWSAWWPAGGDNIKPGCAFPPIPKAGQRHCWPSRDGLPRGMGRAELAACSCSVSSAWRSWL